MRHLDSADGTMARTLVQHIGEQSPIFKLLSPQQSEGLLSSLTSTVDAALDEQRQALMHQFSLDRPESALARLVREITDANGSLEKGLRKDLESVVSQFSLDDPNSALSRLVGQVERARHGITDQFSLDNEQSSLSRLKRSVDTSLADIKQTQQNFHTEVRATLEAMAARRQARFDSTLHGLDFEDAVGEVVGGFASRRSYVYEFVGRTVGRLPRCKVGDHLVTLGSDSAAPGASFIVEAKADASYTLRKALEELETARKNRGAEVGLFIFSARAVADHQEVLTRYGKDVVLVWDADDVTSTALMNAALCLTAALCTAEHTSTPEDILDISSLNKSIEKICRSARDAEQIKAWAEPIRLNSAKIAAKAEQLQLTLEAECEQLRSLLDAALAVSTPQD